MSLTVKNQVMVSLSVNGAPVPVNIGTFSELSIVQNIANKLPTLKFVFTDPTNILHDLAPCVEGAIVEVVLHSDFGFDFGKPYGVSFVVTGSSLELAGGKLVFTVTGIFNAVKFLAGLVKGSRKGTSADVIGQLTSESGLRANTAENTSDSQVWIPNRETYSDFIRNISDHGHAGDTSIMSTAVNDRGILTYKNLDTLAKQSPSKYVVSGSPDMITSGVIPAIGFKAINMAGLSNLMLNYGSKQVQEKMEGNAKTIDKMSMSMQSNFLSISKTIQGAIGGFVRSEFLPQDMGNTHDKYYDAENRNRKGRQTFSNRVEFTTANSSGLELYDLVSFAPTLPTNNQISDLLLGNYIVTAKTKFLASNRYFEKIEIASQGYSKNFGGGLMGS